MSGKFEKPNKLLTLKQGASYARVTRQALYVAIKAGALKAHQLKNRWFLYTDDIDEYRLNKYNRDLRKKDGEYVFDMEKGNFSIPQVCKIFSEALKKPYSIQHLYYLVRTGALRSHKNGCAIVIRKEDAIALLEKEQQYVGDDRYLRRFA